MITDFRGVCCFNSQDLSGKFEPLNARGNGGAAVSYLDKNIDISAIINRSVVVHDGTPKKLKIACGEPLLP